MKHFIYLLFLPLILMTPISVGIALIGIAIVVNINCY